MAENNETEVLTREDIIKQMYQYEAEVDDMALVPNSEEVIHSWYIVAFPEIEALEPLFDIEDLYDAEPACKVYVKDRFKHN